MFPGGIPIGYVVSVSEDEIGIEKVARVVPYVALSDLFEVAVLLDERYVDTDTTKLERVKGSLEGVWYEGTVEEGAN